VRNGVVCLEGCGSVCGRTTPKYKQDHGRGLAGLPGISSGSKALRIAPGRASHFLKLDIGVFAIKV
jgi:hypothetical protein